MTNKKTLEEKRRELMEKCLSDTARIDEAYKKRNMNLAEGCQNYDYYLNQLKGLEPNKSYSQIMDDIEKFSEENRRKAR